MRRDPWLGAILLLATLLLVPGLGARVLWQDEAETALLGRSVLRQGVPVAADGVNVVSQEAGREGGPDGVWRWSPWAQFYLAAAGLAVSDGTAGARAPFLPFGLLTVALTFALGREAFGSALIARLAAAMLALSVPFLLHVRQARWHAPAYALAAAALLALLRCRRDGILWPILLALCGAGLFYVNYFVAITFVVALALAAPVLETWRGFLLRVAAGVGGAALLAVPGALYFDVLQKGASARPPWFHQLGGYLVSGAAHLLPLPMAIVLAVAIARRPRAERRMPAFLCAFALLYISLLSFGPWAMFRYLTLLLPVAALLLALACAFLIRQSRALGAAVLLVLAGTGWIHRVPFGAQAADGGPLGSPLAGYLREIALGVEDAEAVVVRHLEAHARPGDVVVATYGDLPLQFYTRLPVLGGLQGRPVPADPDWILIRFHIVSEEPGKDGPLRRFLEQNVDTARYAPELTLPDPFVPGSPDPAHHRFSAAPPTQDVMTLLHKVR